MIVASTALLAQDSELNILSKSELANARALIQAGRKEVIREELRLTEEEEIALKILPSLKVAHFYQLENKMNAEIDASLALVVPLMDPH